MKYKLVLPFIFFMAGSISPLYAQQRDSLRWTLKTNVLMWATTSPTLGVEAPLGSQWSLDVSGSVNPFTFSDNLKWKHWQVTVEPRYWFSNRFEGHFVGIHAGGGEFNISNMTLPFGGFKKDYRYEGWHVRGGMSYGHRWSLGGHWGLEAELGLGIVYADYKQFDCAICGDKKDDKTKLFFAPTRLGITVAYTLGRRSSKPAAVMQLRDTIVQYRDRIIEVDKPRNAVAAIVVLQQAYPFLRQEGDNTGQQEGVSVRFRLDDGEIDASYQNNHHELERLLQCIREVQKEQTVELSRVTVVGYASPEGEQQRNEQLAASRAESLRQYIATHAPLDSSQITATNGGEDWQGLRQLVEESDMRMKDQVIDIIDHAPAAERKQRLQQLDGGRPWQSIKDVLFPQLRNACYINVWYKAK
ncbi:MAG: DUF3575 domain-containing protein [Prevotella sp.]|nr:DUF3575 domain-containing protein [Prevotella sp.]